MRPLSRRTLRYHVAYTFTNSDGLTGQGHIGIRLSNATYRKLNPAHIKQIKVWIEETMPAHNVIIQNIVPLNGGYK